MNPLVLTCLLCFVVCRALDTQEFEVTFSTDLAGVTGGPASGEGLLQGAVSDDDELEVDEELSGGDSEVYGLPDVHSAQDEKKKRKGKGTGRRRNRHKGKNTTPLNPQHTSGSTSTLTTTEDPCTSTHLGFCIHGYCKHIEGLPEPVCICMKGYDGERCGIQTLLTGRNKPEVNNTELVQTVLVIIAVVLSVISCCAILLMTCAHYRSHKNFMASYLGTATEQEKLQKPTAEAVV